VFAASEHEHVIDGLGITTFVDIGANRGQFALCARSLYPNAYIFSFEPLRIPAKTFQLIFASDDRTRLFNHAIGPAAGAAQMHVSRWDVSSSMLPIGQLQHDNFPFTEESRLEEVTTSRLVECVDRELIAGTALLKLDVQGFELQALQGCDEVLDRFEYVYVEASFVELYVGQALATDVIRFLFAKGFKLITVANLSRGKSQRPIQADFLFRRS
jgi:FkbM family methyltransferase